MASSYVRGGFDGILGKMFLMEEWSGIGTGCPGSGGVTITGRVQKNV